MILQKNIEMNKVRKARARNTVFYKVGSYREVLGCRKNVEEKQLDNKLDNKNGKENQLNVIQSLFWYG